MRIFVAGALALGLTSSLAVASSTETQDVVLSSEVLDEPQQETSFETSLPVAAESDTSQPTEATA